MEKYIYYNTTHTLEYQLQTVKPHHKISLTLDVEYINVLHVWCIRVRDFCIYFHSYVYLFIVNVFTALNICGNGNMCIKIYT